MPEVTRTPIDLVAEESLSSGDTVYLQVVSGRSAVFAARVTDQPDPDDRGMRLAVGGNPYPMTILDDPSTLWVWAETGNRADLEYYLA